MYIYEYVYIHISRYIYTIHMMTRELTFQTFYIGRWCKVKHVCIYVYTHMYTHIYIHMYVYICMHIYVYVFVYIYMCWCVRVHTYLHMYIYVWYKDIYALVMTVDTGWRRLIGCLKLQVIFRKRATNYRALLRKITYEDKASYDSTPPCMTFHKMYNRVLHDYTYTYTCVYTYVRIYIYIYICVCKYICVHVYM